jgi:hypothetical protein
VRVDPYPRGGNVRGQTLQADDLLDEREGSRDHGLRGDKLHHRSVADPGVAIIGLTVARIAKIYTILR